MSTRTYPHVDANRTRTLLSQATSGMSHTVECVSTFAHLLVRSFCLLGRDQVPAFGIFCVVYTIPKSAKLAPCRRRCHRSQLPCSRASWSSPSLASLSVREVVQILYRYLGGGLPSVNLRLEYARSSIAPWSCSGPTRNSDTRAPRSCSPASIWWPRTTGSNKVMRALPWRASRPR
jgi:hypothetical protein